MKMPGSSRLPIHGKRVWRIYPGKCVLFSISHANHLYQFKGEMLLSKWIRCLQYILVAKRATLHTELKVLQSTLRSLCCFLAFQTSLLSSPLSLLSFLSLLSCLLCFGDLVCSVFFFFQRTRARSDQSAIRSFANNGDAACGTVSFIFTGWQEPCSKEGDRAGS